MVVGVPRLEGVLTSPCWTCRVREKMAMDSSNPAETREEGSMGEDGGSDADDESFCFVWFLAFKLGSPEAIQRLRTDPS